MTLRESKNAFGGVENARQNAHKRTKLEKIPHRATVFQKNQHDLISESVQQTTSTSAAHALVALVEFEIVVDVSLRSSSHVLHPANQQDEQRNKATRCDRVGFRSQGPVLTILPHFPVPHRFATACMREPFCFQLQSVQLFYPF